MIEKKKLDQALRCMGKKNLKPQYRCEWSSDRPTRGYCYVVAEVVYHFLAPKGSRPYVMHIDEDETHWFMKDPCGTIIDLTEDQFDESLDYSSAKPRNFLTKEISKRGRLLACLLGYIGDNFNARGRSDCQDTEAQGAGREAEKARGRVPQDQHRHCG
jgi:hypothetical protein